MPLIERPWLALAVLAFAVRCGAAIAVRTTDILPAHHFTDARMLESWGWEHAESAAAGKPRRRAIEMSHRAMVALSSSVYRAAGRRPFLLDLLAALCSSAAVAALWCLAAKAADPSAATLAAAALALWPSASFLGSQFLKDSFLAAPVYAGLALGLSGSPLLAAAAAVLLPAAAILRASLLIPAAAAFLAAAAVHAFEGRRRVAATLAALALAVPLAYHAFTRRALDVILPLPATVSSADPTIRTEIVPSFYDASSRELVSPYTPRGLARFRNYRQENDQIWAEQQTGRRIESQIYPGARLESWMDLALFAPKASFHALFMPLPWLYPMAGKPSRWIAAVENSCLLLAVALALAGFLRRALTPNRAALFAFALVMAAGAGLMEFDLGSAARHKPLYLALLFPFAAEEFLRLLKEKRS